MTHTYGVSDYTAHYDTRLAQDGQESKDLVPEKKVAHPHLTGNVSIYS